MSADLTTHTCRKCTTLLGFKTAKGLTKYLRDVHGPRLQCSYCEYTYIKSRSNNLRRHIFMKQFSTTNSCNRGSHYHRRRYGCKGGGKYSKQGSGGYSGIVTTDDNEGLLDLSFKRIPQTTMPLAATEMVTQQRLKSTVIKENK